MAGNFDRYFDPEGNLKEGVLEGNLWLKYLTLTDNVYVNAERLTRMADLSGRETLMYVMKTLDILDEIAGEEGLPDEEKALLEMTLKWSEVAKGGLKKEREEWRAKGHPLDIHNISSAEIYKDATGDGGMIYTLIKTHGVIGQCIRGEIPVSANRDLTTISVNGSINFKRLLFNLNKCIIKAVSDDIWEAVNANVDSLVSDIVAGKLNEFTPEYRLQKLCPRETEFYESDICFFEKEIFPKYELWYFEAALSDLDIGQIRTILTRTVEVIKGSGKEVRHLNFKPLADNLYYDYEGRKHINVYKKRIIEKYIRDASVQNVNIDVVIENGSAYIDFKFTPVCEKLIEFCVEAERCGLLTFEKSIVVLYDMFGFRKDAFDRLNNEDKYLNTMNNISTSTKDSIIDHAVGGSVVDVGSGGGILLDKLEAKYPEKEIIGTDISSNVIETLIQKKHREGHKWSVKVHNFVDFPFEKKVGSIIFSSILHEIYSYTEGINGRFDLGSVKTALKNAYISLDKGGRIIIRDGIKTEGKAVRKIRFHDTKGLDFLRNYARDFEGLKDISEEEKTLNIDEDTLTVTGDINFLREFMFTYTWGTESYAHEVQEQFGYFTLTEFKEYFTELGAGIIRAEEFLEPGYPKHLGGSLDFLYENGEEAEYPASNCIIVVEKR